jgi:hypothetical protein
MARFAALGEFVCNIYREFHVILISLKNRFKMEVLVSTSDFSSACRKHLEVGFMCSGTDWYCRGIVKWVMSM